MTRFEEEIICWKTNDGLYSYQKQIQSVTYQVCRFVLLVYFQRLVYSWYFS